MHAKSLITLGHRLTQLKWVFGFIIIMLSSLLFGAGYLISTTQTGTQLALNILLPYLVPENYRLNYDTVSGTLSSSTLCFRGLHFQSPEIKLYAKQVDLKISFLKLLTKTIEIEDFIIDTPSVVSTIAPPTPTPNAADFSLSVKNFISKLKAYDLESDLGYDFSIAHLMITNLHFVSGKQHYDIQKLLLNNLNSKANKPFTYLSVRMPEINFTLDLRQDIQINWAIDIKNLNHYFSTLSGDLSSNGQWVNNQQDPISFIFKARQLVFNTFTAKNFNAIINGNANSHKLSIGFDQGKNKFLAELQGKINHTETTATWQGQMNKYVYTHPRYKYFQPKTAKLKLVVSPEKIELSSTFNLLGDNHFTLEGNLSTKKPFDLNGQIMGKIQNLKLLTSFISSSAELDLSSLKRGKGQLNFILAGNIIEPKINGSLILTQLSAPLPKLNTQILIEQLGFYHIGSNNIIIKARGKMGLGEFELDGYAKKEATLPPEIKLTLKGSRLLISNTPEYHVSVSPNLLLTIDKNKALLSGEIYVPEAKIMPISNQVDSLALSEDIVFVKNNQRHPVSDSPTPQSWKKLKTNLDIILGDRVFFEGYGLSTQATGRVMVETRQDNTTKATGKINLIKGRYGAYGHYFSLSHGQLLFQSDPILDPKIDIHAQRIIKPNMRIKNNASVREDIIVGMQLIGRLSKLQTKLYSNPSLPDREIISYLILGHGQHKNTGADGDILIEAISQLTHAFYPKSKRLTEKKSFYDRLKLDWNIGNSPFEDDTTDPLSDFEKKYVNVGKKLSDRLYIQYSLGLADKISVYSMQYLLGEHVILEAKTDSQSRTATDVLFRFESG